MKMQRGETKGTGYQEMSGVYAQKVYVRTCYNIHCFDETSIAEQLEAVKKEGKVQMLFFSP